MIMKDAVFAVIAAKNEEKYISNVVKETNKYVDKVVVVDDGSTDSTKQKAEKIGAVVLRHVVNMGKGSAIKTGCEYAIGKGADLIVLLDADGQHEPKEIPKFVSALKKSDIIFGFRRRDKNMPLVLKFGNWAIDTATYLLYGVKIKDSQCGFRAFRASIYNKIKWQSSNYSMESEMIANAGKKRLKYSEIEISTIYSDKYKGTTIIDGIKIVMNMFWWRISRR